MTSSGCMGSLPGHNFKIKRNESREFHVTRFFSAPKRSLGAPRPQPPPAIRPAPLAPPPAETSTAQHPSASLNTTADDCRPTPHSKSKSLAKKDYFPSQPRGNALSLSLAYACAIPYPSETILSHLVPSQKFFFLLEKYRIHPCTAHSYT